MIGIVSDIISSVKRCSNITHRLLGFARHSDIKTEEVDLREVITEVLGFMGKEAEYRSIDIRVVTEEDVPSVISDRGRLQEVFLNLVTNAFAAMESGGTLSIDISRASHEKVRIRLEDTGCGIPESDIERIFEPFFSTKTGRGGTGLGLSITYRLMREMGGQIDVESEVGLGTVFTVILPVHHNSATSDNDRRMNSISKS
jgi:signal transduction histidine kinase